MRLGDERLDVGDRRAIRSPDSPRCRIRHKVVGDVGGSPVDLRGGLGGGVVGGPVLRAVGGSLARY